MNISIKRPVLRYHGGKWMLAPWIISHFPEHRIYTEVFGGGASVLMRKNRAYSEVYNDAWNIVVNVFQVLRNPQNAKELERLLRLTPFSRYEFENTTNDILTATTDPVELARLTILRSFAGFGSDSTSTKYKSGFRSNSDRSGTTPAHDWMRYPDMIQYFTERLQGVVIENKKAIDVLKKHDSFETLHYVDPPYVHSTRNLKRGNARYAFEMSDSEHKELSDVLHELKGMVVLSGYNCKLYEKLYSDWHCISKKAFADGAKERIECLWLNPLAHSLQSQLSLFNTHSYDSLIQNTD